MVLAIKVTAIYLKMIFDKLINHGVYCHCQGLVVAYYLTRPKGVLIP